MTKIFDTRNKLRNLKIQARNSLNSNERKAYSMQIVKKILASEVFQKAANIMIYKAINGEVELTFLETEAIKLGKKLYFPRCINKTEMVALTPKETLLPGEKAWERGAFGIQEPSLEHSTEIAPENLDLIICPCTVFDDYGGRMGMGAGYYDRYLLKCTNACLATVAFEVQRTELIPMEDWDVRMNIIFTENTILNI